MIIHRIGPIISAGLVILELLLMVLPSEEQRWDTARAKIAQLGSVPASFSSLIRKMRADMVANPPALSGPALFELNRLLRGPSLLSPLAHAALEFHPEKLLPGKNIAKAVIESFTIEELASLVGTLYLTRQVKKRVNDEEWKYVIEMLVPFSTLAGHLGCIITPLGFERSLLCVAFSILGMALFQQSAAKEYATYRRVLKKAGTYFSVDDELLLFGCSNREMGSLLSQSVALSSALASEFLEGIVTEPGKRPKTGMQGLNIWISSLSKQATAPQEAMDAKWYPTVDKVQKIEAIAAKIVEGRSPTAAWILKEGSDLQNVTELLAKLGVGDATKPTTDVDESVEPFEET